MIEYLKQDKKNVSAESPKTNIGSGVKKDRIDYKDILPADEFQLFLRLKDWRKLIGEQKSNIPLYTIFTNEQLAQICRKKVKSIDELKNIPGISKTGYPKIL